MSRSKRLAPPEPIQKAPRSSLPGLRLALAVLLYAGVTVALRLGLGTALRALFDAWNVNKSTVARAPGWARTLYLWQGSLVTLIVSAAAIALALVLFRAKLPRPEPRSTVLWWGIGTGIALVSAALFLITDSLRPEWPLTSPRLTPGLALLWLMSLLAALAEELFTKGVLLEGVRPPWGVALSALAFFLTNGGLSGTVISGINVALMGLLCAVIYLRHGLWADAAFRWGWSFATVFLLGQGGSDRSVYKLYAVSETLLTGGDAGFVYGVWLTVILIVLLAAESLPLWGRLSEKRYRAFLMAFNRSSKSSKA